VHFTAVGQTVVLVKTSSTGSTDLTSLRCPSKALSSSNSPLDDILVIPKAKPPGKRRKMATAKARLITDDDVIDDLKKKKEQKQKQPLKRKSRKKTESMHSRPMTQESENAFRDLLSMMKVRRVRQCPKCVLVYGEDNSVWIQCDSCGLWYDLKCTNVNHDNIPETISCEICYNYPVPLIFVMSLLTCP
jgi:hypothetical protein